jgi:hypothetical protein
MERRNNLYTLSYFRKRLRDSNIKSKILIGSDSYSKEDKRYWTILIDPKKTNLFCTCFNYEDDEGKHVYFSFDDGKQKLVANNIIKTKSMQVIINFIKDLI